MTTVEASAAAAEYPNERVVKVIDTRTEPWVERPVFARPWYPDGVEVGQSAGGGAGPLVFLLSPTIDPAARTRVAVRVAARAGEVRHSLILCGPAGSSRADGHPPAPRPPFEPIDLVVGGLNETARLVRRWPAEVRADVRPGRRGAYVRVASRPVLGPVQPPAERWFRLPAARSPCTLTIGITPGAERDEWTVTVGGQTAVSQGDDGPPRPPPPRSLVLVFDRTCPDAGRWEDARAWVKIEGGKVSTGPDLLIRPDATEPPGAGIADLNAGIRRGLAEGFRRSARREPVTVVWFDDDGDGVSPHQQVRRHLMAHPCGRVGHQVPAEDIGDALASLGYSPGLDLWDALDHGLYEAMRGAGEQPAAVLIVGNSPPHPPLRGDSPFQPLLDMAGMRSARRRTAFTPDGSSEDLTFDDVLDRLAERDVPVAMLFLTAHRRLDGSEPPTFARIQNAVRSALATYFPVEAAAATEDGVRDGLAAALERLTEPVGLAFVHPEGGR